MLKGENVNLRLAEKEDMPLFVEWINDIEFLGEYNPLIQTSLTEREKAYSSNPFESRVFIIEKKDGAKIGFVSHFYTLHPAVKLTEIGYSLIPNERGKGYCTEAVTIMLDYLFLSKDIIRIQAHTDPRNIASQKILEKTGFKREGVARKQIFMKGKWRDAYLYSTLREEWKELKLLTKTK